MGDPGADDGAGFSGRRLGAILGRGGAEREAARAQRAAGPGSLPR
jgi:hypothetical protein